MTIENQCAPAFRPINARIKKEKYVMKFRYLKPRGLFVSFATIAILAITTTFATPAAHAVQYNEGEYTVWDNSKYYIDNQWGNWPSNLQTVSNMSPQTYGISWNVDWNYSNASVNYGLKYPAVHMGWHWGYPNHYPSGSTGLAIQLASGPGQSHLYLSTPRV